MRIKRYLSSFPLRGERSPVGSTSAGIGRVTRAFLLILLVVSALNFTSCATPFRVGKDDPYAGKSWAEIRQRLSLPAEIDAYLNSCAIRYKAEKTGVLNHTQTPEETLRLKCGDCEDFAYLVVDPLAYHGYEALILSVEARTREGLVIHAVGIYRDKETGRWHCISGYDFKGLDLGVSEGFGSERDAAAYIADRMGGKLYQYFVMTLERFIETYDAMKN